MKNVNETFNFFHTLRAFNVSSFILLILLTLINISTLHASEGDYWSQEVNVFNFSSLYSIPSSANTLTFE